MSDKRATGLLHKYDVKPVTDPLGKHDDCRYFVLDPQHDPFARAALAAYSTRARDAGYVGLADDLDEWLEVTA